MNLFVHRTRKAYCIVVKMICLKTENGENDMKCVVPL